MSSLKGANLWRSGKDGAGAGKRSSLPGGGDDFQKAANYEAQYKGGQKTGGGGMNSPPAADNKGVFANTIAGLSMADRAFTPDPGKGRDEGTLDMYSVRSSPNETEFGMDAGKQPNRSKKI